MNKDEIKQIEETIGYTFKNKALLVQAFTGPAYLNECRQAGDRRTECYQVLEFLGDSVLGCIVATAIVGQNSTVDEHGMHSRFNEGDFHIIKSNLSDKSMLSSRTEELGLQQYMRLGGGNHNKSLQNQASVKEDLFESIIGALYLDSGRDFPTVERVVLSMLDIERYLDKNRGKSPKTRLQEWAQARHLAFEYIDKGATGPDHDRTFFRSVVIDGTEYECASGKSIRKAEFAAATAALTRLGEI